MGNENFVSNFTFENELELNALQYVHTYIHITEDNVGIDKNN